ncbi:hypothetical protein, partial [Mesorhizobium sp.]|uniref:hypothetical protein n=1 Tax=Mesorhizobium sp. TaxID=1871066 RepID=UPI0025BA4294
MAVAESSRARLPARLMKASDGRGHRLVVEAFDMKAGRTLLGLDIQIGCQVDLAKLERFADDRPAAIALDDHDRLGEAVVGRVADRQGVD